MKIFENNSLKSSNGITLIALVITIIVLLILAGISIATLTGDNGILTKAVDAKTKSTLGEIQEQADLIYLEEVANKHTNNGSITLETIKDKLQAKGYTIVPGGGTTINDFSLSSTAVTIAKEGTAKIAITTSESGGTGDTPYYVLVQGKYYEIKAKNNDIEQGVEIAKEPTDLSGAGDSTITVTSSNENIATAVLSGKEITITGVEAGTGVTITVTAGSKTKTASVEVKEVSTLDEINIAAENLELDGANILDVYAKGSTTTILTNPKVIWNSESPEVATVDQNGLVKCNERKTNTNETIKITCTGKNGVKEYTVTSTAKKVYKNEGTTNSAINGTAGKYNPVIPKGYTAIDTNDSTWSLTESTQSDYSKGLVIMNEAGNQWVWVPVEDVTAMYMEIPSTENKTLSGTSGDDSVTTDIRSKSATIGTRSLDRTTIGATSGFREPDLVIGNGTEYDYANYSTAEFSNLKDMATKLKNDYSNMIESVRTYGGFYIGRYEITRTVASPKEISGTPLASTNWYNLYKACKSFSSASAESRMIWSNQWDEICKFLATNTNININDSTNYGNYNDVAVKASNKAGETTIIKASGSSTRLKTGQTTYTKTNNIFDLAGNCYEWTQEARYESYRALRGGGYNDSATTSSVTYRGCNYPTNTSNNFSSRPALYVNLNS